MKTKLLLLTLCALFLLTGFSHNEKKATIEGKVIEKESGTPLDFAYVKLFQDKTLITGTQTDLDGNYLFTNIKPGIYNVEACFIGYKSETKTDVNLKAGKITKLNFALTISGVKLTDVVITEYKAPLIEIDNTTSGGTITAERIRNMPKKSVTAIAAQTAGIVSTDASTMSIRGARSNATSYVVNGIRVSANSVPQNEVNNSKHKKPTIEDELILQNILNIQASTESYELPEENSFISTLKESLSTFSIDVDRASYSNCRRFIENGQKPPMDAVRIEELINYFDYDYDIPKNDNKFYVFSDLTTCPWNKDHQILHVALNTKTVDKDELAPSNLVFLIDVSGSMSSQNKLPLVKSSFKLLLSQLKPDDKVAIVVYAGSAGCPLPSTKVSDKIKILNALDRLQSGGSTAGGAGIQLAYKIAKENFIKGANNRVILATDGDFNVGVNTPNGLEELISEKRKENIFLSVLGYGMGNYKSDLVQRLANKGNGNHFYIDNMHEARKVFINELTGTLYALAKDVKIQIEFNPNFVQAYRLIGYENRMLNKEDFNNDKIDAGEIGIGHSVTALYEIVPVSSESTFIESVDALVFQKNKEKEFLNKKDLGLFKIRYKEPEGIESKKIDFMISPKITTLKKANRSTQFAVSVAQFGLLLKDSQYKHNSTYNNVIEIATSNLGKDTEGLRSEFLKLVKTTEALDRSLVNK